MSMAAVLPILSLITGIVLSLVIGFPLYLGIVFAILVTMVSVKRVGFAWKEQFAFGWEGVKQAKPVLLILFFVGLLIPYMTGQKHMQDRKSVV